MLDVTDEGMDQGVATIVEHWGRLVALANAGIQHIDPVHKLAYADWSKVMNVHLDGAFLVTRAALRQMYTQGGGTMLYMGSVHSVEAPLKAPYVAAKHGMLGLCRAVAKEGAEHGYVRTSAPALCAPRWWTSRYRSRPKSWVFPKKK